MVKIFTHLFKSNVHDALKTNLSILMEIIFLIVLSIIFLGFKIYSHQILSMIIIFMILITFLIEAIIYNDLEFKKVIIGIAYYFLVQFIYCFSEILGKRYLNMFIDNIYSFLFKIGISSLIPLAIYGIIISFIETDSENKIFQNFSGLGIYFIDLLFSVLCQMGIWLTIYYFTPCHFIIYESIGDFLEILLKDFEYDNSFNEIYDKGQQISFYILYPILIFIVLVFNEILILNFCNLSFNTKIKIMERGKNDIFSKEMNDNRLFYDENEDDDEEDYITKKAENKEIN